MAVYFKEDNKLVDNSNVEIKTYSKVVDNSNVEIGTYSKYSDDQNVSVAIHTHPHKQIIGGTINYEEMHNLPQINDVTLLGNLSLEELNIASIDDTNYLKDRLNNVDINIKELDNKVKDIEEEIEQTKNDITKSINNLADEIFSVERDVNALDAALSDVKIDIVDIKSNVKTNSDNISNQDLKIKNINILVEEMDTSISKNSEKISSLITNVGSLENDMESVTGELNEIDNNIITINSSIEELGNNVDTLDGKIVTTNTRINNVDDKANDIKAIAETAESIAKGRSTGRVFNTVKDLNDWLMNEDNVKQLVTGDNFYIRDIDVPDYWWDGTSKRQLETQKVDLTEYAKTEELPTKLSELTNDTNFVDVNYHDSSKQNIISDLAEIRDGASKGKTALQSFTEEDPTVPQYVKNITEENISNWNNKSDFSGDYDDLINQPHIPEKVSELENDEGYLTDFTEEDPTVPSYVKNITENNINSWNNKQNELTKADKDLLVKESLVDNKNELTNEEKTQINSWMGTLSNDLSNIDQEGTDYINNLIDIKTKDKELTDEIIDLTTLDTGIYKLVGSKGIKYGEKLAEGTNAEELGLYILGRHINQAANYPNRSEFPNNIFYAKVKDNLILNPSGGCTTRGGADLYQQAVGEMQDGIEYYTISKNENDEYYTLTLYDGSGVMQDIIYELEGYVGELLLQVENKDNIRYGSLTLEDKEVLLYNGNIKIIDKTQLATEDLIPTKTSELENNSGYITQEAIPTKVSDLENDSEFITQESIPTKVSELENDKGYLTEHQSLTKYLDKTNTGTNALYGRVQIGDYTRNVTNAILHIRNVGDGSITGNKVNGACYSVNADGTATLQHKTYDDKGGSAKNAAVLRMSNKGIQFAVNNGSGNVPAEADYKELATQEYVDNKIKEYLVALGLMPDVPSTFGLDDDLYDEPAIHDEP